MHNAQNWSPYPVRSQLVLLCILHRALCIAPRPPGPWAPPLTPQAGASTLLRLILSFIWLAILAVEYMPDSAKSLAGVPLGTSAVVRRVGNGRSIARRLMELGLVPGTRVTVTRVAPLGDPLELRVRNYALSIRRSEALGIEVDETVV
jgi:ferrous iron transport protein A